MYFCSEFKSVIIIIKIVIINMVLYLNYTKPY